ncbi:MAG: HAD hydrolase family protein [Bacteroidota bacterium]|nr:HAD hydrolase family protein [Bacteroidota bacterium]
MHNTQLITKLRQVRLLVTDVDGTLTDGTVYYSDTGEHLRRFHVHDGLGIELLHRAGIVVAFVTKEYAPAAHARAQKLRVQYCLLQVEDKAASVVAMARELGIALQHIAYIGDDLTDLPAIRLVGVSACPADAYAELRKHVDYVCTRSGGNGAVREFCDLILAAQGSIPEELLGRHVPRTVDQEG